MKPWLIPYIAGIIDGEGCIGIERTKGTMSIRVGVTMTDPRVPELLKKEYGGSLIRVSRDENHKDAFMWRVYSRKAERLLRDVRPFLIVKAEQAEVAIAFREHLREFGALSRGPGHRPTSERDSEIASFRESAKAHMHELNKRGVN